MNIQLVANGLLAVIILGIPFVGLIRKIDIFESFIDGGKHGFDVILKIIPFIVGMSVAIGMLNASGFFTLLKETTAPYLSPLGIPPELLPLSVIRPISGSGSIALLSNIIDQYGPDALITRMAATILGSTETTFYVIAIYFGAIGVRRYRHAIASGLIADLAGIIASISVCYWLFT